MKKIILEMTEEEKIKLEMFLIMYLPKLIESAEFYEKMLTENDEFFSAERCKSDSEWYREAFKILSDFRKKL